MSALVFWQNDMPISARFNEGYFSHSGALKESEHVFLKGNNLPNSWQNKANFDIFELGFGSGLNALLTLFTFQNDTKKAKKLSFHSVEFEPLSKDDIAKIHANFSHLKDLSEEFLSFYDPKCDFQEINFNNFTLNLYISKANTCLKNFQTLIDAWYLDGFSPSKNPEMWNDEIFSYIAKLSKPNASLATYSCAKILKDNLAKYGFIFQKVPGYGDKKHMIKAYFKG